MYTDGQNENRTWKKKWKGVKRCQGNICCFVCGDKVPNHKSKRTPVKRVDVISDIDIGPETPLFFLLITKNYPSWKKNKIHHNPFTGFFCRLYIVSFSSWNAFFFCLAIVQKARKCCKKSWYNVSIMFTLLTILTSEARASFSRHTFTQNLGFITAQSNAWSTFLFEMTGQKTATRLRYNSAQQKTQKVSFVNFFSTAGYPSTSTRD